jgi:hypothetical protein
VARVDAEAAHAAGRVVGRRAVEVRFGADCRVSKFILFFSQKKFQNLFYNFFYKKNFYGHQ